MRKRERNRHKQIWRCKNKKYIQNVCIFVFRKAEREIEKHRERKIEGK